LPPWPFTLRPAWSRFQTESAVYVETAATTERVTDLGAKATASADLLDLRASES